MNDSPPLMNPNEELPPPIQDPVIAAAAPVATPTAPPAGYEQLLAQFASDYLQDKRSARRWRFFYRAIWLVLLALVAWTFMSQRHYMPAPTTPHTALGELRGEIFISMTNHSHVGRLGETGVGRKNEEKEHSSG